MADNLAQQAADEILSLHDLTRRNITTIIKRHYAKRNKRLTEAERLLGLAMSYADLRKLPTPFQDSVLKFWEEQ